MKKKILISFLVCIFLIASCASSANASERIIDAELVAQTDNTDIYKFTDDNRVCYVTENNTLRTSAGIWCTP